MQCRGWPHGTKRRAVAHGKTTLRGLALRRRASRDTPLASHSHAMECAVANQAALAAWLASFSDEGDATIERFADFATLRFICDDLCVPQRPSRRTNRKNPENTQP